MMYESVRGALASDHAQKSVAEQPRFKVRQTSDWQEPAANLETEMLPPGLFFEIINWVRRSGSLASLVRLLLLTADIRKGGRQVSKGLRAVQWAEWTQLPDRIDPRSSCTDPYLRI